MAYQTKTVNSSWKWIEFNCPPTQTVDGHTIAGRPYRPRRIRLPLDRIYLLGPAKNDGARLRSIQHARPIRTGGNRQITPSKRARYSSLVKDFRRAQPRTRATRIRPRSLGEAGRRVALLRRGLKLSAQYILSSSSFIFYRSVDPEQSRSRRE
ncbi:hypothetical protein [Oryza sativa Japonica Group]|uniref:Uncharacterized protein n=1 Tax=Oryza sativa subsp. japonica TaxID=39947 RepID=Q5QLS6_ORYSJ|nr:hypothetical protein [Oryza sativa Japonica Group]BAD81838.1 hypothetical protein [Oryza sativa Japonica Group]